MKATTRIESESGSVRKGLQFTMIEEVGMSSESRIYDAAGVRVKAGDRFALLNLKDRARRFGRVVEVRESDPRDTIKPPTVFVRFEDDERLREIEPERFSNWCRIYVEVDGEPTPAGVVAGTGEPPEGWERDGSFAEDFVLDRFGNEIRVGDDIRFRILGDPERDEIEDRGRVTKIRSGSILVYWCGDRSESVVPARGVQKHVELVKSRS